MLASLYRLCVEAVLGQTPNQGSLNTTWKLERADGRTLAGLGYNGTVGWASGSLNTNRHLINFDMFRTCWQFKFINGNVEVEVDWRSQRPRFG